MSEKTFWEIAAFVSSGLWMLETVLHTIECRNLIKLLESAQEITGSAISAIDSTGRGPLGID